MTSIEEIVRRIVHEEARAALKDWRPHPEPEPAAEQVILKVAERSAALSPERPHDLLSLRAAARFLDVAEATLRDWRVDRKGPSAIKVGRLVKYRREDLVQWVRDQRR